MSTIGQQFAKGGRQPAPLEVEVRALIDSDTTQTEGNAGVLRPHEAPQAPTEPRRGRRYVRDLMAPAVPATGGLVSYVGEKPPTTDDEGVTSVDEGGAKPEVTFEWYGDEIKLGKVAGFAPITSEILDDAPALAAHIDRRLGRAYGVAENEQILNGSGVGDEMLGILNWANILTQTATNNDPIASLIDAIAQVENNGGPVDGIVISVSDYWAARGERRSTVFDGQVIFDATGNILGIPTCVTPELATGTALVGSFYAGVTLREYGAGTVRISDSHSDYFTKGKVAVVAEARAAVTVHRPDHFVAVTIDTTA